MVTAAFLGTVAELIALLTTVPVDEAALDATLGPRRPLMQWTDLRDLSWNACFLRGWSQRSASSTSGAYLWLRHPPRVDWSRVIARLGSGHQAIGLGDEWGGAVPFGFDPSAPGDTFCVEATLWLTPHVRDPAAWRDRTSPVSPRVERLSVARGRRRPAQLFDRNGA